ncbi:MAG: 23S rRNA (guanosine(2251)-2'-O)-methyltransferase RlmB [Clostridia bacterium]|nr:23S rRNA (guanosine(2251)-2'-O)-methyltransferase RlmB [Clostridia bacterium]
MVLVGKNAIMEALKSGKEIEKIMIVKDRGHSNITEILKIAADKGIIKQYVPSSKLREVTGTDKNQGIAAIVSEYNYYTIDQILDSAKEKGKAPFIMILDNLTDPHNFGAIIRTAELNGVDGIIIPKRNSVTINETVSKTAAGAIEYVKVCKVTNLNNAIEELKKKNVWIYGLDMDGDTIYNTDLKGAIAIIVGNEGDGMRKSIRENCDFVLSIPMYGKINSLNASVAAGISMYEASRQRNM